MRYRVLLAALLCAVYATAHGQGVPADSVKAAFLYHFAGYVQWPATLGADDPIVIGVMSAPAVESELRRIAPARRVQNRPLRIAHVADMADFAGLHVLYIGSSENARLWRLVPAAAEHQLLLVTDAADGLEHGSVINFVTGERVQFEISLDAADKAGLRLSSRLLAVALRVKKGEAGVLWLAGEPGEVGLERKLAAIPVQQAAAGVAEGA